MIFLTKLYHKVIKFSKKLEKEQSGQITVWLLLSFLVFLSFYMICIQSVQKQEQRFLAEQSTEAGMFSLFSEYEPHLSEKYDLFYLDTSFRSGKESTDELCRHLWSFINENLKTTSGKTVYDMELSGVNTHSFVRATDENGLVFYQQAIEIIKQKTGISFAEDWILEDSFNENLQENSEKFESDCDTYKNVVKNYEDEDEEVSGDAYAWDGAWNGFFTSMVLPSGSVLSGKAAKLENVPSHRELSIGSGQALGNENQLLQKQWFISYLCEYFSQAQEVFEGESKENYLDYQMEYVIAGKASDRENLEAVIQQLLLLREGTNYVFLLSHPNFNKKAEALSTALVGLTGNAALIKGLKHLILLSWAYGESVVEVRQILGGKELSLLKSEDDWQVSLGGLFALLANPAIYDEQKKEQQGLDYEDFLRILLSRHSAETLAMRSLDIIEGELQLLDNCQKIHIDHCVEQLNAQVWLNDIYLERTYAYK